MRSHGRTPLLAMAFVTTTVALTPVEPPSSPGAKWWLQDSR
jgi:hypothetical protein